MHPYTVRFADIGGNGGGAFDHAEYLMQQGYNLGCGSKGMHLTTLHVERWRVLSHVSAVYTSWSETSKTCAVPGSGNIKDALKAVDINIGPDDRVTKVGAEYGLRQWAAGAVCLDNLQITIGAAEGMTRVESVGDSSYMIPIHKATYKVVDIPQGLTLAGIGGRTGDSWDQVVLYVCPYLPGQGVWRRELHKHYCQPFRKQVQTLLLCLYWPGTPSRTDNMQGPSPVLHLPPDVRESLAAALFHVTFMQDTTASGDVVKLSSSEADYIATWIKDQVKHASRERFSDDMWN
eukprot:GHUV01011626.1.p1 GENE.GHUV01011626.1~~GHUV01011626.1.p1  ORF type:complete len:290 (+),score=52.35 GHUV01011626.1:379-1248(+)